MRLSLPRWLQLFEQLRGFKLDFITSFLFSLSSFKFFVPIKFSLSGRRGFLMTGGAYVPRRCTRAAEDGPAGDDYAR